MTTETKEKDYQLTWIVTEEQAGISIKHFLTEYQHMSRRRLAKVKHHGQILRNEQPVKAIEQVEAGDRVQVIFPIKPSPYVQPEKMDIHILFEDEHLLIVDKPPGQCVHPTLSQKEGTLAQGALYHWQQQGLHRSFHALNRLDKDTSGIVIVANNPYTHHLLAQQQRNQTLKRRYVAVVHGHVEQEEGTIEAPIGRDPDSFVKRMVRRDGQRAVTHYKVVERRMNDTILDVSLQTGRTHQIRVHMQHMGHSLVGDSLYGGKQGLISRQALHAYQSQLQHPHTLQPMTIKAPLPTDLQSLVGESFFLVTDR